MIVEVEVPEPKKLDGQFFECPFCNRRMTKMALVRGHMKNDLLSAMKFVIGN